MKRLGLFLLGIVVAVGMVGCGGGDDEQVPDVIVVGRWTHGTDFRCDGDPTTGILRIYNNGTFQFFSASGTPAEPGTYSVDGQEVTMNIQHGGGTVGTRVYSSNPEGTEMSLRDIKAGFEWCYTAILVSRDPNAP